MRPTALGTGKKARGDATNNQPVLASVAEKSDKLRRSAARHVKSDKKAKSKQHKKIYGANFFYGTYIAKKKNSML
jgi:hypothetical protein